MPIGALPIGDVMLSQKIALETCEREVRAVARRFTPNGFHFRQTRPLADRADRIVLRGSLYADLRWGLAAAYFVPASLARQSVAASPSVRRRPSSASWDLVSCRPTRNALDIGAGALREQHRRFERGLHGRGVLGWYQNRLHRQPRSLQMNDSPTQPRRH